MHVIALAPLSLQIAALPRLQIGRNGFVGFQGVHTLVETKSKIYTLNRVFIAYCLYYGLFTKSQHVHLYDCWDVVV